MSATINKEMDIIIPIEHIINNTNTDVDINHCDKKITVKAYRPQQEFQQEPNWGSLSQNKEIRLNNVATHYKAKHPQQYQITKYVNILLLFYYYFNIILILF